jgi:hypothetical protein
VPKSEIVEVVDGDLGLVEKGMRPKAPKPTAEEKQRTFAMLAHIGRERGYKPGWASQKYRDRFGVLPAIKSVVPIPPDDAMRSWVRSRDIAYAKRRQGRQVPAA